MCGRRAWALGLMMLGTACWNFDGAYEAFCDAGHCVEVAVDSGVTLDGGRTDAGPRVDAGSVDGGARDGGSSDAGGGVPDASTVDAGPDPVDAGNPPLDSGTPVVDAGGPRDSGAAVDAGPPPCRGWGTGCTGGDCCAISDAGVRMACSRNNLCQEYAPDCRESGFDCTSGPECCGQRCESGRCAICSAQNGTCTKATDCCPGLSCAADGHCTYAGTGMSDGDRCYSSGVCNSKWCDPSGATPNDGICKLPGSCGGVGSVNIANCCTGLDAGSNGKCCHDNGNWCGFGSDCCSGNCIGLRCSPKPYGDIGERCFSGAQCAGALTLCEPVGLTCTLRICLPPGLNLFSGCCTKVSPDACRFADGSSCMTVSASVGSASQCCIGTTTGTSGNLKCTELNFF